MLFRAEVFVTLKQGVLDPQGKAVKNGLGAMGYREVEDVRVGKYIQLELTAENKAAAEARLEEMAGRLLANPVIENFRLEVVEV